MKGKTTNTSVLGANPVRTFSLTFLLLALSVSPAGAVVSGKNGRIVYERHDGDDLEIYSIRADGTGRRQLTDGDDDWDHTPAWSPDGKRILWSRYPGGDRPYDLWTMDSDGGHLRRITRNVGREYHPTWAPNGKWIAFSDYNHIYRLKLGEDESDQLTSGDDSYKLSPTWSPNGKRIAYVRQPHMGGGTSLCIVGRRGENPRCRHMNDLTLGGSRSSPSWSPNGKRIAFAAFTQDDKWEIYSIRRDGSGLRQLTDSSFNKQHPSWAPNGKQIVFSWADEARNPYFKWDLYRMRRDGSRVRAISTNFRSEYHPDWQSL